MESIIANKVFDKAFPKERTNCEMIKAKKFEKDIKSILKNERILDYRCYLRFSKQIIYYAVETKYGYIAYKEDLITKEQIAYFINKEELL